MTRPNDMRGLSHLPRQPIPAGRFLVHNQVIPCGSLGGNGFRAWTQGTRKNLIRCRCDFGGCKNAELHTHYRVQIGESAKERRAHNAGHDACQKIMKEGGAKLVKDGGLAGGIEAYQALRERASRAGAKAYQRFMRTSV
jgi:hypothetical protein